MEKFVVTLIVIGAVAVYVVPLTITALKGKQGMATAGVFFHPIWWVGAIRLAKPESFWARRFYSPEKLAAARERESGTPMFQPESDRLAALSRGDSDTRN
ncbi:MAG TPA: hypothetical protein VGN37_09905 [Actinocatenispora sp.]